jgi:hypothetical protein
LQNLHLVGC